MISSTNNITPERLLNQENNITEANILTDRQTNILLEHEYDEIRRKIYSQAHPFRNPGNDIEETKVVLGNRIGGISTYQHKVFNNL